MIFCTKRLHDFFGAKRLRDFFCPERLCGFLVVPRTCVIVFVAIGFVFFCAARLSEFCMIFVCQEIGLSFFVLRGCIIFLC